MVAVEDKVLDQRGNMIAARRGLRRDREVFGPDANNAGLTHGITIAIERPHARAANELDHALIALDRDDLAGQRVVLADEAGHESVRRFLVDTRRRIQLLDDALMEHGDAVRQRQRLALARAVAAKPAVLVLDDPLSALDVDTEAMVEDALRTVLKATTALIVAHRPSTVQLADKVALMQDGKITAIGKHSDLLATNEHYRFVISSLDAAGDLIEVK